MTQVEFKFAFKDPLAGSAKARQNNFKTKKKAVKNLIRESLDEIKSRNSKSFNWARIDMTRIANDLFDRDFRDANTNLLVEFMFNIESNLGIKTQLVIAESLVSGVLSSNHTTNMMLDILSMNIDMKKSDPVKYYTKNVLRTFSVKQLNELLQSGHADKMIVDKVDKTDVPFREFKVGLDLKTLEVNESEQPVILEKVHFFMDFNWEHLVKDDPKNYPDMQEIEDRDSSQKELENLLSVFE